MRVSVWVKPGSKKGPLVESEDSGLVVYVQQRAVDGQANEGVIELIAKHFNVKSSAVSIVSGFTSRRKIIEISDT